MRARVTAWAGSAMKKTSGVAEMDRPRQREGRDSQMGIRTAQDGQKERPGQRETQAESRLSLRATRSTATTEQAKPTIRA